MADQWDATAATQASDISQRWVEWALVSNRGINIFSILGILAPVPSGISKHIYPRFSQGIFPYNIKFAREPAEGSRSRRAR